jgi:WD40 repeat protein
MVSCLQASFKPLSACAFLPDGSAWVSGSMEGELSWWDALTHHRKLGFFAHIRPISAIQFSPDGRYLATASWDRKLLLRCVGDEQTSRPLIGHEDIVAGCRWSADGTKLLSWSHDGSLRFWDADAAEEAARFVGHADRITAACLSRDGNWVVSGGRDGVVKLWDLRQKAEVRSVQLKEEVRCCWFLDNGGLAVTVNADGWVRVWSLPAFEIQAELATGIQPLSGELSPSGGEVALGTDHGHLHFITVDIPALEVAATPRFKPKSGIITRFLGKQKIERVYQYTCPSCGHNQESINLSSDPVPCQECNRLLRVILGVPQVVVRA